MDGLGPVSGAWLGEDVVDVRLHGRLADVELAGDLRVRESAGDESKHLGLAGCQVVWQRRRRTTPAARSREERGVSGWIQARLPSRVRFECAPDLGSAGVLC